MQAVLLATSHYLQPVTADALPSLHDPLVAACGTTFRRVDRFAELALLGAARCARGRALDPQCGIYFASATGPVASNARVQEQMLRTGELPRPFDFVNTLGGAAGFYIASNLGLAGPDWFLGDREALLAAMDVAMTDLASGIVPQVLVGVVEEVAVPMADQRRRLGVSAETVLAEGSHWWLLGPGDAGGAGRSIGLHDYAGARELAALLAMRHAHAARVGLARDLDAASAQQVHKACTTVTDLSAPALPFHASGEAAWFAARCAGDVPGAAALVANGRLLHLGA